MKVRMHRVESSAIEAVGYSPRDLLLHVRFRQTGTYTYGGVPPEVFRAFLAARSKGRFYNQYIRNSYGSWKRLEPGEETRELEWEDDEGPPVGFDQ